MDGTRAKRHRELPTGPRSRPRVRPSTASRARPQPADDSNRDPSTLGEAQPPSGSDYSRFATEDLGRCVDQLHGIHNSVLAEIFAVVRQLHARGAFIADGAKDAAAWLQQRLGLPYRTAARWAETALALGGLPHLDAAFANGRLCLDKVSAAIELATPENDREVAEEAARLTVKALQVAARRRRTVTPEEEAEARKRRGVWWTWTNGGTVCRLGGRLTAEQGLRVTTALERTAQRMAALDGEGPVTMSQRRADALAALAEVQIADDADPDRANILIHVDIGTLREGVGSGWNDEGALLSADTISKLLCDSRLQGLVEDERSKPLGVGRAMRTPPRWMRRVLKARDHTCCFPGCDQTLFLVPHHKQEWTKDDGPTDPENLPLLCRIHHALVHTKGWFIEGSPAEGLTFIGPCGVVRDGPPPLDYDVKKWLWEDLYRPSAAALFDSS